MRRTKSRCPGCGRVVSVAGLLASPHFHAHGRIVEGVTHRCEWSAKALPAEWETYDSMPLRTLAKFLEVLSRWPGNFCPEELDIPEIKRRIERAAARYDDELTSGGDPVKVLKEIRRGLILQFIEEYGDRIR